MSVPGAAQSLLAEADQLVAESSRYGLVLRLAGSVGVLRHCSACRRAVGALDREPPGDLDFFAYGKQRIELVPKSLHWKARARVGTRVRWYEEVGDAQHQGQGDAGIRER